ncbi:geranylgeranyl reductase family protein [Hoeflea sp. TYP-13]|uniref:geranylgeranyl reductase family protein n=1 Tax=Hoeflea sp. TYP-13 TaxID=3230023 RepID=UPI0034C5D305
MRGLGHIVETDVLVCGLGPAGASAARAAAQSGASVIAIERNARPGLPVQCAEFVPMMLGSELPDVSKSSVQDIREMRTFVGGENAKTMPDFRGHIINRALFDQRLIESAMQAGARCHFAAPLRGIGDNGTTNAGPDMAIRCKVIIGADGPRSPVALAAGLGNRDFVETRQITVDLRVPHNATDIFLHRKIAGGYAWLFPKGDVCNVGLGVDPAYKHHLKPLLEKLHRQLVGEGRVGAEIHKSTGGLIPVGGISGLTGKIGAAPALICGDAAGLTNAVTGAGINSAVVSGRLAGEAAGRMAAGDADAADDYRAEVESLFARSIAHSVRKRRELMRLYDNGLPEDRDLRDGWIAFPQYWQQSGAAAKSDKAREMV